MAPACGSAASRWSYGGRLPPTWSGDVAKPCEKGASPHVAVKRTAEIPGDGPQSDLAGSRVPTGEASPAHSHPCAVKGYVVAGSLRTQLQGEPVMTYKAGETFYEAPNGVHVI